MKNSQVFAIVCCLLGASFSVSAQTSIGVRGGVSFNTFKFDSSPDEEISNLLGIDISVPLEIRLSPLFALQPELNFIKKGIKGEYSETYKVGNDAFTFAYDASISLNYLSLPVFGKLFLNAGSVEFFTAAGPYAAYALNGEGKYTETRKINGKTEESESGSMDLEFNDEDNFKRFDFGLSFGAGAAMTIRNGKIFLDARYNLGLVPVNDGDENDKANRSYSFALGYLIPIK